MVQYHFRLSDGPDLGPIGAEEFQRRQEAGEINDETMVWRSGMVDWTTYAKLRAIELRAAQPPAKLPPPPPPLPGKAAAKTAAPGVKRIPCGVCGQEWPESLLTLQEGQHTCGNCQNKKKQEMKEGRSRKTASNGVGAWLLMIMAVVCAGCLAYKVSHYGIRLPKGKVQELTAPSTYGK